MEEEQEEHEEHKDDEAKEQHDDTQGATESSDQSTEESSRSGENREQSSEESESPEQPDNPMGRPKEKTDISESQDDGVLSRLMHDGSGETDPKVKEDRVHASDLPLGKGPRRDSPPGDRREHIDDSKGTGKKRIESEYGHRQGPDQPGASEGTGFVKDEVCLQSHISKLMTETTTKSYRDNNRHQPPNRPEASIQCRANKKEYRTPILNFPSI